MVAKNLFDNVNNLEISNLEQYLKVIGTQYLVYWVEKAGDERITDIVTMSQSLHAFSEPLKLELAKRLKALGNQSLFRFVDFQLIADVFYSGLNQYVLAAVVQSDSSPISLTPDQFLDNFILIIVYGLERHFLI